MLPDKLSGSRSILGSVSDFYQHRALEDTEKENDETILKLPPILQKRQQNNNINKNSNDIQSNDAAPTIPSLFSPMSKTNRRKSNMKDLMKGKKIERQKENRKLQQLLKGDRVYATREERVLKRWEEQQKEWNLMKRNIATKIGKKEEDLVITRAEEWREMIEEIDLMTKSIPATSMSSSHWQHTLRKKTGLEETTHTVPIGNIFSGLYCNITQNPRKPIKESIRKPTNNYINEPGKGPASKHWRERSTIYQFRKKLHKKMVELKPNNLDHLDGLEIRGFNMFNLDKLEYPTYSYKKEKDETKDIDDMNNMDNSEDINAASESFEIINHENVPIIGPSLDFIPSNIILFNSSLYQEQTKVLEIKNNGTTAILLTFKNVEQKFINNAIFLYPTEQFSILPGKSKSIAFYFKPFKPGSYHLIIDIESFPNIQQKSIQLQGICLIEDEDKVHRDTFIQQIKAKQIEQDATSMLYDMIDDIPESDIKTKELPKAFCVANRENKLYWHPQIYDKLEILSQTIIGKFRRRKRNSYKWNLSVSTLKTWLKELENIQSEEIIKELYDELMECIECAQQIPEPNPLYYDLWSTLMSDLTLQIPRFSWRSKHFAQTAHNAEQQQTAKAKPNDETEQEQDESEAISEISEWNVYQTQHYHNQLYDQCKQYFNRVIDQFENSVINNNQVDNSVTMIDVIKSKLNPEQHRIITFGNWINHTSNNEDADIHDEDIKTTEILSLNHHCINSIYSNSNMTIMTSNYKTWMCSNIQSLNIDSQEQTLSKDGDELEDDEDKKEELSLNEFELLPIFDGFNIVEIFCNNDMINVLTDTGDVYYSLFTDLSSYQTEALYNKNIIKITGSTVNNKCVALSKSGDIFEWDLIHKTPQSQDDNKNKKEDKESENKENEKDTFEVSASKELTEIDVKIIDVAITSTAYVAITEDQKLIIWGDYDKIYSANMDNKDKKPKKKKDPKQKDDDENIEESTKKYLFIETEHKFTAVVSCLNNFIILDDNGKLYSFGFDEKYGALGLGPEIAESLQPKPINISNDSDDDIVIKSISSWDYGCIALDNESNIWYWGKRFSTATNDDNDDHKSPFYFPTKIEMSSKYDSVKKAMITNMGGFLWC